MPQYRKKPVVVNADEYRPGLEDGFAHIDNTGTLYPVHDGMGRLVDPGEPIKGRKRVPIILTREGYHAIGVGDFIITGVEGERYPIKPGIFAKTYEPAD